MSFFFEKVMFSGENLNLSPDSKHFCLHVWKYEFWKFLQVTLYLSYTEISKLKHFYQNLHHWKEDY